MYSALTCYCLKQFLTRTVWWAVPVIWLPIVCWCISLSIQMGHTLPQIALLVVIGIFVWTLIEYTLHRFLFHIKTKSYWLVITLPLSSPYPPHAKPMCVQSGYSKSLVLSLLCILFRGNTIHYLLHGCHHKHPMDSLRLVFPPAATAVLCIPVCILFPILYPYNIC